MTENDLTELRIKNMVCPRCELVVKRALEELDLEVVEIELGRAVVKKIGKSSRQAINKKLEKYGFELLEGKDQELVEQIKIKLIQYVRRIENADKIPKTSDYLTEHLNQNYASLSTIFSKTEDITIEKYVIRLKIERVRELLSYGELTLSEIAHKLNYSSVAHLSNQFKQITGMSVTDYKKASDYFRQPLDGIS